MPDRVRLPRGEVSSNAARRLETSSVLRQAYAGHTKMIAASRGDRGVSVSTIYKQTEGLDANPLEHLTSDLDRLAREGAEARVTFVLRWLCDRYGGSYAPRAMGGVEIEGALSESIREASEAHSTVVDTLRGGITEPELPAVRQQVKEAIESLHRLDSAAQKSVSNVRTMNRRAS